MRELAYSPEQVAIYADVQVRARKPIEALNSSYLKLTQVIAEQSFGNRQSSAPFGSAVAALCRSAPASFLLGNTAARRDARDPKEECRAPFAHPACRSSACSRLLV